MCQQIELAGFPVQLFSLDPSIAHWLMVLIILLFNTYHNSVEWRNKHLHIVNMIMCGNLYFKKARCSVEVWYFNLVVQMWRGSRVSVFIRSSAQDPHVFTLSKLVWNLPLVSSHSAFKELIPHDQFLGHRLYNGGARKWENITYVQNQNWMLQAVYMGWTK